MSLELEHSGVDIFRVQCPKTHRLHIYQQSLGLLPQKPISSMNAEIQYISLLSLSLNIAHLFLLKNLNTTIFRLYIT